MELANGLSLKFGSGEGHVVGDTWVQRAVRRADELPAHASKSAVEVFVEGTRDVKQANLTPGSRARRRASQ